MAAIHQPTLSRMPSPATLHYVFDPLCGWCYAAAPLVAAARRVPGLAIELHGGGMMSGANRRAITPQWRDYVMPHDRRIAQLSGQPFGDAYFDELLRDTTAVMDSTPPTTAILAAEQLAGRGLDMLQRLQRAHYVEGRRIADVAVLKALALELGFAPDDFADRFDALSGDFTATHLARSREWLHAVGGQGFPTFALQAGEHTPFRVDPSAYLGRPDAWVAQLEEIVSNSQPTTSRKSP